MAKVWIDAALCTGCGACVSACPVAAIALIDGYARVDVDRCQGCEACIEVCPVGAIREVLEVEVLDAPSRTLAPQPLVTLAQRGKAPLAPSMAAVVAVTASGLALRGLRAVAQMAGRWLLSSRAPDSGLPTGRFTTDEGMSRSGTGFAGRGGRRSRERRRGSR